MIKQGFTKAVTHLRKKRTRFTKTETGSVFIKSFVFILHRIDKVVLIDNVPHYLEVLQELFCPYPVFSLLV